MKILRYFFLISVFMFLVTTSASAVTISEMVKEIQQTRLVDGKMTFAWWIPTEYWDLVLEQTPGMTDEVAGEFLGAVEDYDVFAVANGTIGASGISMDSREELTESVILKVGRDFHKALDEKDMSQELQDFLALMRPTMAQLLGQFGEGLVFLAFQSDMGSPLLDPFADGRFTVDIKGNRFNWRLPLGCLLPRKMDPVTNEDFPGNFNYNPYTGGELTLIETDEDQ